MTRTELHELRDELGVYLRSRVPEGIGCVLLLVQEDGTFCSSRNVGLDVVNYLLSVITEDSPLETKAIRTH